MRRLQIAAMFRASALTPAFAELRKRRAPL
jgi:hypothetical protein